MVEQLLKHAAVTIDLLEKSAAECDRLEASNRDLAAENLRLRKENANLMKSASAAFKPDAEAIGKLAAILEDQGMLVDGMDVEKGAAYFLAKPDLITELAINLLRPAAPEGMPTNSKSAGTLTGSDNNLREATNVVTFNGRQFTDEFGFMKVLAK